MDEIIKWSAKGFFISIFSVLHKERIEWTVGVRVGITDKNNWMSEHDEGCQFSSFNSYSTALDKAIKFCEKYKPTNGKSKKRK